MQDLWQGKGSILLLTNDPAAFELLPWLRFLAQRFPRLRVIALSEQAPWWQALAPELDVVAVPSAHVFGNSLWWKENLPRLAGDWCIDLNPTPAHPLSLALAAWIGHSWQIGTQRSPLRNIKIECPATTPFDGSVIRTLASTFQWGDVPAHATSRGHKVFLQLPTVPVKKRLAWLAPLQELQRRYKATVVGLGDLSGWETLSPIPQPNATSLLRQDIGTWIGPTNATAGALKVLGVRVMELPPRPNRINELRD